MAKGYWEKPEDNRESFAATLREANNRHPYFRTGDLGFVDEGQLYITGRLKDLIIIRGVNYYPHDIEATTEASHDALAKYSGAAFAIESDGQEQVVVVQELKRSYVRQGNFDEIITSILQAVAAEHLLPLRAILLVRPGAVPKTTSGKIRRQEVARMYRQGEFRIVAEWDSQHTMASSASNVEGNGGSTSTATKPELSAAQTTRVRELEEWLAGRLANYLKLPRAKLDSTQPFARFGIGSLTAVRLAGELSDHLGRAIPPTVAFDHPDAHALAHFLVTGGSLRDPISSFAVATDEPLAVVGLGCRLPAAATPNEFWELLRHGKDGIGSALTRYRQLSDKLIGNSGDDSSSRAGLLEQVDQFDPGFFGICPREADEMDPQQRLLLEVIWETFEDAGIRPDTLAGSRTGVFVGISANDYLTLQTALGIDVSAYSATGNALAMAANRISYTFDLCGPSLAVDTACSSSLVAVHQACESLRAGNCTLAIAGGVNLILNAATTSCFDQAGMLSSVGACQTFAAGADGFVRGEGCGAVLLKRLSQAQADGDRIYCLVRGSAVNQDGRSIGLTAPNGVSQQAVIRRALADARVEADEVDYVEAHGTGTPLGDPIEMGALAAVFASDRQRPCPLQVGSVKTNIGHLEAAAGIAGLIKVCLSLDRQAIPAHLHFHEPSPHIDWTLPLEVPTTLTPWQRGERPRIAGVSSFGFGGTNAHVVLAEAPSLASPTESPQNRPQLLTISAKSPQALKTQAANYAKALVSDYTSAIGDFCYTANARRQQFRHRLAVRVTTAAEAARQLKLWSESDQCGNLIINEAHQNLSVKWVFSGQGGILPGAGRQLYECEPIFRQALDQCSKALRQFWSKPLKTILWEDERSWHTVDIQPALFCLQYALGQMWEAWGIRPTAVLGHSLGEYAAACVAGVFGLQDALRLVCLRAELIASLPESGAMLAVLASDDQVRACLPAGAKIDIAAINGPRQTVVSGPQPAINDFCRVLERRDVRSRLLQTTHAFHSPLIDPILDRFHDGAEKISYSAPAISYLSPVTGDRIGDEVASAEYWRRNLRQTVKFYPASQRLVEAEKTICLEIGAGATLASLLHAAHPDAELVALPGLTGGESEWDQVLDNLGELYAAGATPNWKAFAGSPRRVVSLPSYPQQRSRHWFDRCLVDHHMPSANVSGQHVHPLLGKQLDLGCDETVFSLELASQNYLTDHRLGSSVVFPAAGYLEIALAAAEVSLGKQAEVSRLVISSPLSWSDEQHPRVQVVLAPTENGFHCRVVSRNKSGWLTHAECDLQPVAEAAGCVAIKSPAGNERDVAQHYQRCDQAGLNYGPAFRGVKRMFVAKSTAWGEVVQTTQPTEQKYHFHPTTLDACLQIVAGLLPETARQVWLPSAVECYSLRRAPHPDEQLSVQAEAVATSDATEFAVDLKVTGENGDVIAQLDRVTLRPADGMDFARLAYSEQWVPKIRTVEPAPTLPVVTPDHLAEHLLEHRERIIEQVGLRDHLEALEELEAISAAWVADGLRKLGADLTPGDVVAPLDLAHQLGVAEQHHRLLHRFCQILEDAAVLDRLPSRSALWQVRQPLPAECPRELCAELLERHPQAVNEIALVERCGGSLPGVLRGQCDPLSLLFPEDGSVSAAEVYRASPGGQAINQLVAEAVVAAGQHLPAGRGLRILEVGAGTGATTEAILQDLDPRRTQFTFTDISPAFLNLAKAKFSQYAHVDYRLLDIERSPVSQGFKQSSYDLIVAANVLHATADLSCSLANVRQLLAPGGLLIVVEGSRPIGWLDLTFGLTPGWWRFHDTERRPDYPLLSQVGWLDLLEQEGFRENTVIQPVPISERDREPENSLILSQLDPPAIALRRDDSSREHWLILGGTHDVANRLATRMHEEGDDCQCLPLTWHARNKSDAAIHRQRVLAEAETLIRQDGPRNIVFLLPVDKPAAGTMPPQQAQELNEALLAVVQSLAQRGAQPSQRAPRLWIVTRGGQAVTRIKPTDSQTYPLTDPPTEDPRHAEVGLAQATMWGWLRTLNLERPDWQCKAIDLDPVIPDTDMAEVLLDELRTSQHDNEREIAFRGDLRLVRRVFPAKQGRPRHRSGDPRRWVIADRGSVEGLRFVRQPPRSPGHGEITVDVRACGVNFRDLLNTLGLYPDDVPLGAECAGVVTVAGPGVERFSGGERVAVIAPESMCEQLTVPASSACQIPEELSFAQAATIPVAFLTACMALEEVGRIKRETRVLIHAAAGGVGMACLQLARDAGAEVFATASVGKHETLRQLGVRHLYDSRGAGFGRQILDDTQGQGVDLVVNSLSEEFLPDNLQALRRGGVYVDISKPQAGLAQRIAEVRNDLRYEQVDLARRLQDNPVSIQARLADLVARVRAGRIDPLPMECVSLEDAPAAFRKMRSGSHVGKLVLTTPVDSEPSSLSGTRQPFTSGMSCDQASRESIFRDDATYIMAGGLGGLGLFVARWMSLNGAAHIALLSRSMPDAEQRKTMTAIEHESGCRITHWQTDLSNSAELAGSLDLLRREAPLAGVFHFAGVLDNALIENQSAERFARVFAPKVSGAWNLHLATVDDPLENFVLFSSAAAMLGSPGQANHAAANAFLDALACHRRRQGRPGLSINWGPWARIGSAQEIERRGVLSGIGMIDPTLGLAFLQDQLQLEGHAKPQIAALELDCEKLPGHLRDLPIFQQLLVSSRADDDSATTSARFLEQYKAAPEASRRPLLLSHLRSLVARALGIDDPVAIRADEALFDLGLDSLTSLELRNQIQSTLQVELPSTILFDYPTPNVLVNQLAKLIGQEGGETRELIATPVHGAADTTSGNEAFRNETNNELSDLIQSLHVLGDDLASWADQTKEAP